LFTKEVPATPSRPQPRPDQPQPAFEGTYFGPNVSIEGTVTGSEMVLVEGQVKGTIHLTADLRIGTQARVEAKVHARNVTVEGRLTGDISADARVELIASARVDGNIKAPKIIVADGAHFRGNVDMGSAKPAVNSEAVKK